VLQLAAAAGPALHCTRLVSEPTDSTAILQERIIVPACCMFLTVLGVPAVTRLPLQSLRSG
jgi:hypothetical protein